MPYRIGESNARKLDVGATAVGSTANCALPYRMGESNARKLEVGITPKGGASDCMLPPRMRVVSTAVKPEGTPSDCALPCRMGESNAEKLDVGGLAGLDLTPWLLCDTDMLVGKRYVERLRCSSKTWLFTPVTTCNA